MQSNVNFNLKCSESIKKCNNYKFSIQILIPRPLKICTTIWLVVAHANMAHTTGIVKFRAIQNNSEQ